MRSKPASVRKHEESIAKKEAKATAEDKHIPARFIEYANEWNRTERFADWRSCKTIEEWRTKYQANGAPDSGRVL